MRHLIVTVPTRIAEGFSSTKEMTEFIDALNARIKDWREGGTPLVVAEGITIELIDLTAIAPGHRVCCL